jgi:MFS family permease
MISCPDSISDRDINRGLRRSIIASSVCMFFAAVSGGIPYAMLLDRLQASGKVQGLAAMFGQLALASMLVSAIFSERISSRRAVWRWCLLVSRCLWFVPPVLIWLRPESSTAALIIGISCISGLIGNMGSAVWQSWMADLIPENARSSFWSTRQSWTMLTFLVSMGLSGWMLDAFDAGNPNASTLGFACVFFLAAISGVADILIHWSVPERPAKPSASLVPLARRLLVPLRHPSFRNLALAMGFWALSCTIIGSFSALYLKRVMHATYTELSVAPIAGALSCILAGIVASYIIDRVGPKTIASVMIIICPFFGIPWFLITDDPVSFTIPLLHLTVVTKQAIVLLGFATFLCAGLYSVIGLCHLSLVAAIAPKRGRTVAMAVQWTLIGLIGAIGPLIGGFVMDGCGDGFNLLLRGSTRLNYIHILCLCHAAVAWFIALPLLRSIRVRREPLSLRRAISLLVPVNPLRFASGIYYGRIINLPATPERRLRAVEAVGDTGAEIAVTDLCAKLGDPSLDVREAAVVSLGRIGSREAITRLLAVIRDPESDLTVGALRALRETLREALREKPMFNPMGALLQQPDDTPDWIPIVANGVRPLLFHPNIEVVREASRVLGWTPNPAARDALLDILHTTRIESIALATAAALGRQGDVTAVYAIIPRMRATANANAEKAFAVAAGDLLGVPDGFYKMLTREEQTHNSALADLVRRLTANSARLDTDKHGRFLSEMGHALAGIEDHYEARNLMSCADTALRITRLFAQHRYQIAENLTVFRFLPELERHDTRFAAGAWFIALLSGAFARADAPPAMRPVRSLVEIQLAVYVLSAWADDLFRKPRITLSHIMTMPNTEGPPP